MSKKTFTVVLEGPDAEELDGHYLRSAIIEALSLDGFYVEVLQVREIDVDA